MKRIVLYPFGMKSEGYVLLRDTLRKMLGDDAVLGVFPDGKYKAKPDDLIVDWGFSKPPVWAIGAKKTQILNHWDMIYNAVNKEQAFALFSVNDVQIPDFTTSAKQAAAWVSKEIPVVQRQKIAASKGKGASVAHTPSEFNPEAKLYTKLIPKAREFRVHVFNGKVIDRHEKVYKGNDPKEFEIMVTVSEESDDKWVWKRSGVIISTAVAVQCLKAVKALGLDFGGVDVVTDKAGNPYVLEVNTAPWLGTTTVKYYAEAIKNAAQA